MNGSGPERAGWQFYALLGPNGAGQGDHDAHGDRLAEAGSRSITVHGIDALADPIRAKRIMAWVSDEPMIYDS